jgi:hypothetical protein
MNNKALYWIALGVFALGLNSEYQKGNLPLAHRVADRAGATLCRIATRAEQTLAMASALTGRPTPEFRVDDQFLARQQAMVERVMAEHQAELDRAMDLRQADLDRVQAKLDQMHSALERAQMVRERVVERSRFRLSNAANRRLMVVCPKTGKRIAVQPSADSVDVDQDLSDVDLDVDDPQ